jgi:outer membrane protein
MLKRIVVGFFLLACSPSVKAQEILSLKDAIQQALNNNFGIQVADMQIESAENQIYRGNAGMTPVIDWNTNVGGSLNQVNQVFLDGRELNRLGNSISPGTNLSLAWTLYDGRRMHFLFDRLKNVGQLSQVEKKLVVQNTIAAVMQSYYTILRMKKSEEYLKTIIGYYEERLTLTEERWKIGRGSKLDFLQSKTDIATQQVELVNTQNQLKTGKIQLNNLLGRDPQTEYEVVELEEDDSIYNLGELLASAKLSNRELLVLNKSKEISLIDEKVAESFRRPRIALNTTFGYAFNKSNAGFMALNQSVGLNGGVSAVWNIFNGHQISRNIQAAKINTEILEKQREGLINQIEADITSSYQQFLTDRQLLELEEENRNIAEENLAISLEKFRLGAGTILELNEAQRRFDASLNRLVNAQYNVRASELQLLRLSGGLVE